MTRNNQMNYIALNQQILNKSLLMGTGFVGREEENPFKSEQGLNIYINGSHKMPDHGEIETFLNIGEMYHPEIMFGMPGCGGKISYDFGITEKEFLVIVRVELDDFDEDNESEPAADLLALTKRDELPGNIKDEEDSYLLICQEMLSAHFSNMFEFHPSMEDLKDWTFNEDALHELVQNFFKGREE